VADGGYGSAFQGYVADGAFESIGLILQRPLQRATYGEPPPNTLAFAWTGGVAP
jgi:hypothetical protein